jgi:hypothetical protein
VQVFGVGAARLRDNGPLDLVVSYGNQLGVLLGNGDGTFQPLQFPLTGESITDVALDHFRGADQPPDLAVVSGDHVDILLGNGDGTFGDPTPFALAAGFAQAIAVGDLNGDGKLDIVTSHFAGTVSVLLGNGDGTFQAPMAINGVAARQYSLALADFNGDGNLDIVTSNYDGNVAVLLGNGDGTFRSARYFDGGPQVASVHVADFDQDGHQDLVVQNYNGMAILYGNGDGTFQNAVQYDMPFVAQRQLQVADFNGDTFPDISVLSYNFGTVDVYLNVGRPSPAPHGGGRPATPARPEIGLSVDDLVFGAGDRPLPALPPDPILPVPEMRPPSLEARRLDQFFEAIGRESLVPYASLVDGDDLSAASLWWQDASRWRSADTTPSAADVKRRPF